MNNERRKAIGEIADQIANGDLGDLDGIASNIEALRDEEQEYLDNMPENLQTSERGTAAEQAVSQLDTAADAVRTMLDSLNEATTALEEAKA